MIDIQIRQVDPSYLAFLRNVEPRVPEKDSRPWLWPVVIDGIPYGIPCTTQDTGIGYAGFIRCIVPNRGLHLRYMIPLPPEALLPDTQLSSELAAELRYYEEIEKYIEAEAQILHRLSGLGQMDRIFQYHSCNFQKLDRAYRDWQPGRDAGHFLYPKEVTDMPISKNGKEYYTKEQYEAAKYNGNALEYARSRGYQLVRQGTYYVLQEHDSMVFTPDGRWFWNSRGLSGSALEFQIYYEGKTITQAVLTLAGDRERADSRPSASRAPSTPAQRQDTPRYPFKLPPSAQHFRQMFYYLCSVRGLDKSVVQEMIRQNRLYQSAEKLPTGRTVSNTTFVYLDAQGNPIGAYQRGMMDREGQPPYKRDVPGSDKRFGWLLASPFHPATEVRVFEAAIDAATDASLDAIKAGDAWREKPADRLSLEGLSYQPLQTYLQAHPGVQKVTLMLDADEPGRRAAKDMAQRLQRDGFRGEISIEHPPFGKDWNNVLTDTRAMQDEVQQPASYQATEILQPSQI